MKGLYITQGPGAPGGPTVGTAQAGDSLNLTARVYNYSLVDRNSSSLSQPAAGVHVRLFGQKYCSSGSGTEASCQDQGGRSCGAAQLCGSAFQIGPDQVVASIPGYQSPTGGGQPNWAWTTVPFDTTHLDNTFLVFWVLTWMEDSKGNTIVEIADHGLSSNFLNKAAYTQITQVPVEAHSNNVGLYGMQTPFFVAPAGSNPIPPDAPPGSEFATIKLFASRKPAVLEESTRISARIASAVAGSGRVSIAYYDGDPKSGDKLFDRQSLPAVPPYGVTTMRTFFRPAT